MQSFSQIVSPDCVKIIGVAETVNVGVVFNCHVHFLKHLVSVLFC